jgi:anti-sigma B factor antagonist
VPLTLSHTGQDGDAIIALDGELDLASAPDLAVLAGELIQGGAVNIIVDAEKLSFCDSSGLRSLVSIANELRPSGGRLAIVNAQPIVLRVLELTGLVRTVLIAESVDDARTTLQTVG